MNFLKELNFHEKKIRNTFFLKLKLSIWIEILAKIDGKLKE